MLCNNYIPNQSISYLSHLHLPFMKSEGQPKYRLYLKHCGWWSGNKVSLTWNQHKAKSRELTWKSYINISVEIAKGQEYNNFKMIPILCAYSNSIFGDTKCVAKIIIKLKQQLKCWNPIHTLILICFEQISPLKCWFQHVWDMKWINNLCTGICRRPSTVTVLTTKLDVFVMTFFIFFFRLF